MEKMPMQSKNIVDENIEFIAERFPNCIVEAKDESGKITKMVDFNLLKQELSKVVVEGNQERYVMNWPDKRQAILTANAPINKTLRPCPKESVDFDNTHNIYIEGDNLDVLKLLRETYLGKIKMIYIDPPYNTRKDLIYKDNFDMSESEYLVQSEQRDEEGNRMFQNKETCGKYHTNWLNMIYPRLKLARDLLTDDGIIFISIDDNEVNNMIKICNEIFSEHNFIAQIIVEGTPKNDPVIISTAHEYCLVYVKNYEIAKASEWGVNNPLYEKLISIIQGAKNFNDAEKLIKEFYQSEGLQDDNIANYNKVDAKGLYRIGPVDDPQGGGARDTRYNPITKKPLKTPNSGWRCSLETWNEWVKNGEIFFPDDNTKLCSRKVYIQSDKLDLLRAYYKIQTRKDTDMLKNMFGVKVFQFPKPVELIKKFIDSSIHGDNQIVLDFFSGSATTAQAVMELNAERGNSNIHFILVQLRESLENNISTAQGNREKQTALNAVEFCKSNNLPLVLTEIGKERIRRAGTKLGCDYLASETAKKDKEILDAYAEVNAAGTLAEKWKKFNALINSGVGKKPIKPFPIDIGFRVFKLDSSNMKDVYYNPADVKQRDLLDMVDNIKGDRSPEDLLFQVMLDMGIMLDAKIERIELAPSRQAFNVNDGDLICCFDVGMTEAEVTKIAKMQPLYAVFRDSSIASDKVAVNFDQIFETYSPTTIRKVL